MALRSPSRISSASRSARPFRPTMAVANPRPSSPGLRSPPALPVRGVYFPARCVPPAPSSACAAVDSGRPVPAHAGPVPPCLVAGFHSRFVPPPPFLTTLAAFSSLDPVVYFSHTHPWGSVLPVPRWIALSAEPEGCAFQARGAVDRSEELPVDSERPVHGHEARTGRDGAAASAARAAAPASGSPPRAPRWASIAHPVARMSVWPSRRSIRPVRVSPSRASRAGHRSSKLLQPVHLGPAPGVAFLGPLPAIRSRVTTVGGRFRQGVDRRASRERAACDLPALPVGSPLGVRSGHVFRLSHLVPPPPFRGTVRVAAGWVPAPRTLFVL